MRKISLKGLFCPKSLESKQIILTMKITLFLLLFVTFQAYCENGYSQSAKISIPRSTLKVSELLTQIESQTDYLFVYNKKSVDTKRVVNVDATNQPVSEILDKAFEGTGIHYVVEGNNIVLTKNITEHASTQQQKQITVKGVVTDMRGEPIIGASVVEKGTTNGTITDLDGNFTLKVPSDAIINITYVGYQPQSLSVSGQTTFKIKMEEESMALEQVVVTAMGIKKKAASLTYSTQQLGGDELTRAKDPNMIAALAGKSAGVQISKSASGLGGSAKVSIRGIRSANEDGNNQPLYVIDGVPIMNPMGEDGDLDYGNPASAISPDDIESIEVLKGANAAALYGSDAANGVILITTRKATKKSGLGVSYGYNMQFTFLREFPAYQNVYGSASLPAVGVGDGFNYYGSNSKNGYAYDPSLPYGIFVFNWANPNQRSWGLPMLGFDLVGRNNQIRSYVPNKDGITDMYEMGVAMTHSVSVNKVFNGAGIRFNYTGIDYDGMLKNFDNMKRHTFDLRVNMDLAKWLSSEISVNYQLETADNRDYKGDSNRNPMRAIMNMPRDVVMEELLPWKRETGEAFTRGNGFYNPYWLLNEISNGDGRNNFRGNLTLNIKPIQGMNIRLRASVEKANKNGWKFDNYYTMWDIDGQYETFREASNNYNYEGVISYNRNIKKVSLSANLGTSMQKNDWYKLWNQVSQLAAPDVKSLSNNASILSGTESVNAKEKQSVFGMLSLGYHGLFVDGTFRNDWSSSLPKANNSYFYASGSASAVLTEIFPKLKSKTFSFAKLRGSIARVGNDAGFDRLINSYSYGGLFRNDMAWFQGDAVRKNPNLKPETTISKEIGAEVRLLDGRLTADVTYYDKYTRDQIVESELSYLSNYQRVIINSGKISNKGWEISVSGVPVKVKNFEWKTIFNWSKNNSMVESLPEGIDKIQIGSGVYNVKSYAEVGKPYGAIYAKTFKRDAEGYILCQLDGSPKEGQDYEYLGCVQADWRGGWNNVFRLGNFSFSVMFDFQKGGKFFSQTSIQSSVDGQSVKSLEGRDADFFSRKILGESDEERYGFMRPQNANTPTANGQIYPDWGRPKGVVLPNCRYDEDVEGLAGQQVLGYCTPERYWMHYTSRDISRFIYDASYVKLREITVSYDLPKKWLRKTPFQTFRVAAVGRNIATLFANTPHGLDPQATSTTGNAQGFERGFNLPSATYGFDIKVSF